VPALIRWTSPGLMTDPLPIETVAPAVPADRPTVEVGEGQVSLLPLCGYIPQVERTAPANPVCAVVT
jgi:hypothetical protein